MGGLILDNIIVFLYRAIANLLGKYRSRRWPSTKGSLTAANANESAGYPLAEVAYSYLVDGKTYCGVYKKGFWYRNSATYFAKRLIPRTDVVVRYRPDCPKESFLISSDQRQA